jgi:hypothetical protein
MNGTKTGLEKAKVQTAIVSNLNANVATDADGFINRVKMTPVSEEVVMLTNDVSGWALKMMKDRPSDDK